jgi:hypothetical protein
MAATRVVSVGIGKLTSSALYADSFLVEIYSDSGFTTKIGSATANAVFNGTVWAQKDIIIFDGLVFGNTYWLKAFTVSPISGTLSTVATFSIVAGAATAPAPTYTVTFQVSLFSGISYVITVSSIPSDIEHFEWTYTTDGSVPSATTKPRGTMALNGSNQLALFAGALPSQTVNLYLRAVNTSQMVQAWTAPGTGATPLAHIIDNLADTANFKKTTPNQIQYVDPTTGQITVSTILNNQASALPVAGTAGPFSTLSYDDTLGQGAAVKISWVAITMYNPDGTQLAIPASTDATQKATSVPTPTLTAVAGGAKGARTYFVRIAYAIDGGFRGFSAEASLAVGANQLLKVTSPPTTAPWTSWAVFLSTSTNTEVWFLGPNGDSTFSFGTDFTEPTAALALGTNELGPQYATINTKGVDGFVRAGIPYNTGVSFCPYWDKVLSLVRFYSAANSGVGLISGLVPGPQHVRGMYLDQHYALAANGLNFTTLTVATGASGGTTGGGGLGGGCPLTGTKIVPLGNPCFSVRRANSKWIEIRLQDGRSLIATPDHPVYTDRGKTPLKRLRKGQEVVTDSGMVAVISKRQRKFVGEMEVISMTEGHLYYANGILSHNIKVPQ